MKLLHSVHSPQLFGNLWLHWMTPDSTIDALIHRLAVEQLRRKRAHRRSARAASGEEMKARDPDDHAAAAFSSEPAVDSGSSDDDRAHKRLKAEHRYEHDATLMSFLRLAIASLCVMCS